MKRMITVMLAVSLLALPSLAMARPGARGKGMRGHNPAMMKQVMKKAGVTDAQIKKIQDLHFAADKEQIDLRHLVQKERLDLKQLLAADKPGKSAVFAKLDKIGTLQIKLKKNRVGLALSIRAIVGPEIWEKLEAMRAMHHRGKRGSRGYGPGGMGGHPGMGGGPGMGGPGMGGGPTP